jgi:FkbM family methyltransferase
MHVECSWAEVPIADEEHCEICLPPGPDALADAIREGRYKNVPPHFRIVLDMVEPGSVVVDLGAHLGTFAVAAASRGARVIAVEAAPRNVAALHRTVERNGFTNMTVMPAAVSDRIGTVSFAEMGAWGRITTGVFEGVATEVEALPLPSILERAGADRVDVVKMDVEGSEPMAIAGMRQLLDDSGAPAIVFESNPLALREVARATVNDLLRPLARHGYLLYLLTPPGQFLRRARPEAWQPDSVVDYLAVKDEGVIDASWVIGRERTEEELVARVCAEAASPTPDHRRSVATQLASAPPSILGHPKVLRVLELLSLDRDHTVAHAARWWDDLRPLPTIDGLLAEVERAARDGAALAERAAQVRGWAGSR